MPVGGVLEWLVNTGISAVVGLAVGLLVTDVVAKMPSRDKGAGAH